MTKIFGALILLFGVLGGAYLGLYVMLYGGIVQIINGINPLSACDIALGILRVLFCEIGIFPVWFGVMIGFRLMVE